MNEFRKFYVEKADEKNYLEMLKVFLQSLVSEKFKRFVEDSAEIIVRNAETLGL